MSAPLFETVPVSILSRGITEDPTRFTTLRFLPVLFPKNPKYLIVPKEEASEYRRCARGIKVLAQPGTGLADAERFAVENHLPGSRLQTPFIIKCVDDIKDVRIMRLDGTSSPVTSREFEEACRTMIAALQKNGGLLAGFMSSSLQKCRIHDHQKLYDTSFLDMHSRRSPTGVDAHWRKCGRGQPEALLPHELRGTVRCMQEV